MSQVRGKVESPRDRGIKGPVAWESATVPFPLLTCGAGVVKYRSS